MKKSIVILGLISSLIAIGLALSPYFHYAFIPVILSLVLGFYAFYIGRNTSYPKKPVQFIFIVAIIAISMVIYKSVQSEIPPSEQPEQIK